MANSLEVKIVQSMFHRILQHSGEFDLTNEIIVASPYQLQVHLLRAKLNGGFCNPRNGAGRDLNVLVESIDSLQGSERQIAIISLTRSNRARTIGFLNDAARLNVGITRAKRLLILIGDFSTMTRSSVVATVYNGVCEGAPRTRIECFRPTSSRDVDHAEELFQKRVDLALNQ